MNQLYIEYFLPIFNLGVVEQRKTTLFGGYFY